MYRRRKRRHRGRPRGCGKNRLGATECAARKNAINEPVELAARTRPANVAANIGLRVVYRNGIPDGHAIMVYHGARSWRVGQVRSRRSLHCRDGAQAFGVFLVF